MVKLLTNIIFLVALISFVNSVRLTQVLTDDKIFPQYPPGWEGPKVVIKPSVLYFNLDDMINRIYVNNNKIFFQFDDAAANKWDLTKTMKMILYEGDIIRVVGNDSLGGFSGFLGSLHFFNNRGEEIIYNTGPGWYCDGKPAIIKGDNEGKKGTPWPYMKLIEKEAKWIWSNVKTIKTEVTCIFEIPCL